MCINAKVFAKCLINPMNYKLFSDHELNINKYVSKSVFQIYGYNQHDIQKINYISKVIHVKYTWRTRLKLFFFQNPVFLM